MSRESVSHTDSSSVLLGARRSSPGIAEVSDDGFSGAVAEVLAASSRGSSAELIETARTGGGGVSCVPCEAGQ